MKRPQYFMRQLLEPENADDDAIPLYDYAFSAASNGPPPQGTPSHVRPSAHDAHVCYLKLSFCPAGSCLL